MMWQFARMIKQKTKTQTATQKHETKTKIGKHKNKKQEHNTKHKNNGRAGSTGYAATRLVQDKVLERYNKRLKVNRIAHLRFLV